MAPSPLQSQWRSFTRSPRRRVSLKWMSSSACTSSSTARLHFCSTARAVRLGDLAAFILPMLAGAHRRHVRRMAAVVHPESRRRSARRVSRISSRSGAAWCSAPRSNRPRTSRSGCYTRSRRLVAVGWRCALIGVFAAFVNAVHLGYFLIDPDSRSIQVALQARRAPAVCRSIAPSGWRDQSTDHV